MLEALIRAGALDRLGANRATLMVQLPLALQLAEQHGADQAAGQDDLFGMSEPGPAGRTGSAATRSRTSTNGTTSNACRARRRPWACS